MERLRFLFDLFSGASQAKYYGTGADTGPKDAPPTASGGVAAVMSEVQHDSVKVFFAIQSYKSANFGVCEQAFAALGHVDSLLECCVIFRSAWHVDASFDFSRVLCCNSRSASETGIHTLLLRYLLTSPMV